MPAKSRSLRAASCGVSVHIEDVGLTELHTNSVASLEGVADQTIRFAGQDARLVLRSPSAFGGTIKDFGQHHSIELEANATGHSFDTAAGVLTLTGPSGEVLEQLLMESSAIVYVSASFHVASGLPTVITFA